MPVADEREAGKQESLIQNTLIYLSANSGRCTSPKHWGETLPLMA